MGLDLGRDLSIRALATNVGQEERLEELFGLHRTRPRTASMRWARWPWSARPRRTAHLRGRLPRAGGRRGDRRAAARRPDRGPGGQRALQDGEPTAGLQHHGPLLPPPTGAVRVRQLAPSDGPVRRPGGHHGQAAGGQRVARGDRRHRHLGGGGLTPTTWCGPSPSTGGTSSVVMVASDLGARPAPGAPSPRRSGARLRDRLGVRIGVEIVALGSLDAVTGQDRAKAKRFLDERAR